jgi:hypothetical protein
MASRTIAAEISTSRALIPAREKRPAANGANASTPTISTAATVPTVLGPDSRFEEVLFIGCSRTPATEAGTETGHYEVLRISATKH